MAHPWIDVTEPLREGIAVWPGDPPLRIERVAAIARGDSANVSAVSMCLHTGTHVDAPRHYIEEGAGIEAMPPEALVGPARVIAVGEAGAIRPEALDAYRIRRGERILLKTGDGGGFLTRAAADHLVTCGIRAIGIDSLSIGAPNEEGDSVHRTLLAAAVWIVERLALAAVEPGDYELVCLPLNLPGADGSPARALLRRR